MGTNEYGIFSTDALQKLKFSWVAGTTADTDITITGIATEDVILHVAHFTTAASIASVADDTANCSITAANTIQSSTDTDTDQLFVIWVDISA